MRSLWSVLQRLANYVERRGLRNTIQRQTLAQLVMVACSPFKADQIIDTVRQLHSDHRITHPTVYRVLGEFVEAKMLLYTYNRVDGRYARL
jgi:Fe2+ or Zn2+ uptake regulation protein